MVAKPSPVKNPGTQESASPKPHTVNDSQSGTAIAAFSIWPNSNGWANCDRLSVGTCVVGPSTLVRTSASVMATFRSLSGDEVHRVRHLDGPAAEAALQVAELVTHVGQDAEAQAGDVLAGQGLVLDRGAAGA